MTHLTRRSFLTFTALSGAALALAGCTPDEAQTTPLATPLNGARTLVAYFSVPLTDDPDADMNTDEANSTHIVDGVVLGNTQYVARLIQERLKAATFRIETAKAQPLEFSRLEDEALADQEANARPRLKAAVPNLDDYDTVFVGYPIWWYDLPMPMFSFFEQHDLAGKTVIPFSTHGGSQLSGTVERITELLPDASVTQNAFTISRDDMASADTEVNRWLDTLVGS